MFASLRKDLQKIWIYIELIFKSINKINTFKLMMTSILVTCILTFASLFILDLVFFAFIRLLQSSVLAILRLLSKIWLLEFNAENLTAKEITLRSSWSEIIVSISMGLGSFLGEFKFNAL